MAISSKKTFSTNNIEYRLNVISRLKNEAIQQYTQQKRTPLFRKLFHSTQVKVEKKLYITAYIEENFFKQLTIALHEYQKQSLGYQENNQNATL